MPSIFGDSFYLRISQALQQYFASIACPVGGHGIENTAARLCWQYPAMAAKISDMDLATRILIVDDDKGIRTLISEFLDSHGYLTQVTGDADGMRAALAEQDFDLIVLDVMMPKEDGLTALRSLGPEAPPVVMLSAVGSDVDRIVGLEMGADDYLAKPCNPRELLARIRTVLRRTEDSSSASAKAHSGTAIETAPAAVDAQPARAEDDAGECLNFAGWCMNVDMRMLFAPNRQLVNLSDGEFRLLRAFAEHPRRVLTRDQLLDWSRGSESESFDRAIDVQLSRLRRKLAESSDDDGVELIRTIRNEGYVFVPQVVKA